MTIPERGNSFYLRDRFQIMWHYPTAPVIQHAAEKLFADPNSPWVPLDRIEDLGSLLTTPLIGLGAFRQEILRGLNDSTIAGSIKFYANGNTSASLRGGEDEDQTLPPSKGDPLAPAPGVAATFRLCDYYAYELSHVDGFPKIVLYWPQTRRDAAVAACKVILERYGDDFQFRPQDPYFESIDIPFSADQTRIRFPKLDHPATPDDVKEGRAIFSLTGPTRLCQPDDFPIKAWRPDHKEDPSPASSSSSDGSTRDFTDYITEGRVWQVEEQLVNGKWERYYGFVGRYQLEKVPASEIKFSSP